MNATFSFRGEANFQCFHSSHFRCPEIKFQRYTVTNFTHNPGTSCACSNSRSPIRSCWRCLRYRPNKIHTSQYTIIFLSISGAHECGHACFHPRCSSSDEIAIDAHLIQTAYRKSFESNAVGTVLEWSAVDNTRNSALGWLPMRWKYTDASGRPSTLSNRANYYLQSPLTTISNII